jgi:hypothetical protein
MHLGGDTSGCTLPLEFLLSNWWSWAWDPPHGCWWRPYKSGVESCTKFTPPPFMPFPRNSPPKTHPNNKRINHFFVVMCISMLFYILQVLIPGQILRLDDIGTARLAIFLSCITCLPLFTLSWQYLFRDKPPVARIPIGQNLLSAFGSFTERTKNSPQTIGQSRYSWWESLGPKRQTQPWQPLPRPS